MLMAAFLCATPRLLCETLRNKKLVTQSTTEKTQSFTEKTLLKEYHSPNQSGFRVL